MRMFRQIAGAVLAMASVVVLPALSATPAASDPDARAEQTLRKLRPAERTTLLHGLSAAWLPPPVPPGYVPGAGYVYGIPRLGVPPLIESDASLGVAWLGGRRGDKEPTTALPSGPSMASSWNPQLLQQGGAMIGTEAHAKGFNVLLAGGNNLLREPRNGRTFEYFSEDPLLSGTLAGAAVAGIQSAHVLSTVKHYALNDQETGRAFHDVLISEPAARESDLLSFQLAIERGQPGAVMCAYNRINGGFGCGNDWLLNQVLKRDWGYKGWVMSDWGAVHQLDFALAGLDQQSGQQIDPQVFFDKPLLDAAKNDAGYVARVDDMNRRVLRSIYAVGLDRHPPKLRKVDVKAHAAVAEQVALQGSVLLRNNGALLPLPGNLKRIAVIGGNADAGVMAGGGSSLVHGPDGPAALRTIGPEGPFSKMMNETYHDSSPIKALRARVPNTQLSFRSGRYLTDAVAAARQADVAVVFATQYMSEGYDVPDLSLPDGQDALIAAVAAANPRTVVVLQTGGPVRMPWLGSVGAVLQAWYPGARGAEAITALLFGDANPSGRLPITFPSSEAQLPRPALDGAETVEPGFVGRGRPGQTLTINYDIEGSDVGYRWHARQALQPLFAFGFGLSYTRFDTHCSNPVATPTPQLTCSVRNMGDRAGAEVVQIYLTSMAGTATRRLAGYQRVMLAPGESRELRIELEPRVLAHWRDGQWQQPAGQYLLASGRSSLDLDPPLTLTLPARNWK